MSARRKPSLALSRVFRARGKLLPDGRRSSPAPEISGGVLRTAKLDPREESFERAFGGAAAHMLAGALALRLIEENVLPADHAELERGIKHGSTPIADDDRRVANDRAGPGASAKIRSLLSPTDRRSVV
jgi:hypothetical protein